ncbi:putative leucine-rich repeat-containing protein DDB_G0290503 [Dreissena polymorpha]|uniref:putative leucine-rich repeat-containing protein DDB_G0290503 n=1 Tax=Dreissena polymorpha TaxID=45954 RepID=UPI002264A25A|nr:putative leucine-rich repeat-containing protein DDB_G0290503 [Dreissena polymorpha]
MSEEENENKPKVCANFEPQAWKKNKCMNCFQPPEAHANISTENGGEHTGNTERSLSPSKKGAAATSLKDKYEQLELEKDKPKPLDSPHTLPRTKGKGGLSTITEMYNTLDMKSGKLPQSPSGNIPPPVFPKTFKKDGDSNLKMSQFGSVENVNSIGADSPVDFGMKNKLKFGSMENISSVFDKKKESVKIPVLKNKVEDSSQNAAPITASKPVAQTITTSIDIVNKQDSSQNEMKAGPTVINKQTNSKVDIFKLPPDDKKSDKKSLKLDINTGNEMNKVDKSSNAIQTPLTKDSSSLKTLTSEISSTKNKSVIFTSLKSKDDLKSPVGNLEKDKKPLGNLKDQLKSPTPDKDKKPVFDLKDRLKSPTHNEDSKSETSPRKDKFPPVEKKTDIKPLKLDIKTDKERNKVDETSNSNQTPSTKESNTLRTLKGALSPTKNESDLVNSSNSKDNLKSPVANIEKDKNLTGNLSDKLKSPTPDKDKNPLLNLKDRLKSPPHNEDSKSDTLTWKDKLKSQSKDNKIESKSQLKSPTTDFEKKPTFAPKSKAETDKLAKEEQSGLANKDQLNQISQPKEDIKSPGGEQKTSRSFKLRDNLKTGNVDTDKQSAKQIGKSETDSKKGFSFKDSLKSNKKDDNSTEIQKENESLKSKTLGVNDKLLSTPTNKLTDLKDKLKPKEQTETNVTLPDIKDQSKLKSSSEAKTSKKIGEDKDLIKTNEDTSIIQSNKLTDLKDKLKSKNESESKFGNKLTDFKDKLRSKTETESKTDNSLTSFKDKLKSKDETETKPKTKLNDFKDNLKSKNDTDSSSTATDKLKSKDAPDSRTASKMNDVTDKVKSKEDSETVPKKTDLRDALKTKNDPQSKTSNKVFDFKDKFKSKQDGEQATIKVVDYRNAIKSKEKDKGKEAKQNDNKNSKDNSQSTSNALMLKSTKSGDDGKNDGHNNLNKINVSLTDQMGEETAALKSNAINAENNDKKDDSNNLIPQKTDISPESKSDDKGNACALISPTPAEKSPLHVDTQVFTSSRSKTSGESNLVADGSVESASGSTKRQSDISIIDFRKDKSPVESKQSDKDKGAVIPNGDIRDSFRSMENSSGKKSSISCSESEIEKLKEELINMTERCQNLETENTLLSDSIKKKDTQETALQKQKNEVETSVKTLRQQLKCLEDKCQKLETDNVNLINDVQTRREVNHLNHNSEKESDESDEKMSAREKLMEDIIEENEQLKEEIKDLKVEMEEMYDSFRDQEAEEFRELQKELEFTAKNCRILQFKLRKTERRNEQNEKEKATYEERLRKLQNQFQDRDAVAHIHSLEDELRMAKDVSVRLHDEMDLLEERRGKVEEENRHLTELLEQADRKQFRLELEVDKLRDKVIELRQELRTREFGPEGEPRKLNCSEFLALHRENT